MNDLLITGRVYVLRHDERLLVRLQGPSWGTIEAGELVTCLGKMRGKVMRTLLLECFVVLGATGVVKLVSANSISAQTFREI